MGVSSLSKAFQNGQREETKVPELIITPEEAMSLRTSEVLMMQQSRVPGTWENYRNPFTIQRPFGSNSFLLLIFACFPFCTDLPLHVP